MPINATPWSLKNIQRPRTREQVGVHITLSFVRTLVCNYQMLDSQSSFHQSLLWLIVLGWSSLVLTIRKTWSGGRKRCRLEYRQLTRIISKGIVVREPFLMPLSKSLCAIKPERSLWQIESSLELSDNSNSEACCFKKQPVESIPRMWWKKQKGSHLEVDGSENLVPLRSPVATGWWLIYYINQGTIL